MLYVLDLVGTGVFAVSGALLAGRKRMDLFGVIVLALATALGGGTVRDLALGVRPVFWVHDATYVVVAAMAAVATVVAVKLARIPAGGLALADAAGLAVFTVIGCQRAEAAEAAGVIVVTMGVATAVVGGMVRDVLGGEVPLVLRREVYATAALAGGVVYVALRWAGADGEWAAGGAAVVALGLRLAAMRWKLRLPVFRNGEGKE